MPFVYHPSRRRTPASAARTFGPIVKTNAGQKAEFTLTMWVYKWRKQNGDYMEQVAISGYWNDTEYSWIDEPADVVDVRWTVGNLVYISATPYDGVRRDQHTNGIASFTGGDQVAAWDLLVNFTPVSPEVHGKWTNVFTNFTHTWWGVRLSITLGSAPQGGTGTITITTDGKTWTEGAGLAFQIGSEATKGSRSDTAAVRDGTQIANRTRPR